MNEKLELLSLAKDFEITKESLNENKYDIFDTKSSVFAIIEDNKIEYYTGEQFGDAYIDIERLMKLKELCEFLIK